MTTNASLLSWINEIIAMCQPDKTVWIDGSKNQADSLYSEAFSTGELIQLNQEKHPGCVLHRSNPNDVARCEERTFICCENESDSGPTNNWWNPDEAYSTLKGLYDGCMKGRTMYIIPFIMGPAASAVSKVGVEVTDSIYVSLSMLIMTRAGTQTLWQLDNSNDWVRCLHSKAEVNPDNRYICHFPQDNTIWSINSGYGGNALLSKKSFALRIASCQGKREGWLAEHMLILGIENPEGEIRYIAAAFPSACGKTNLAMMIPPAAFSQKGYRVWCVGDDIAWLHIGEDGYLYAVNAENGFFGVAPGTNVKSNPNAVKTISRNTIFTNVAVNLDDNTVWWEQLCAPPENMIDWKGAPWTVDSGRKGAHLNARFTAPIGNCPVISPEFNNPGGVKIDAILFGGRRAKTAPLVFEAFDWEHGVFIGSAMASETTAAANGQTGVVRRDPMAMLPFCGYNMADYWNHWLDIGKRLGSKAPKIFNVNWFKTDDDGRYIWPGFCDNFRVLLWMLDRASSSVDAAASPIGFIPHPKDIDTEGLNISRQTMNELLSIDHKLWIAECEDIAEFYDGFGERVPGELKNQLEDLKQRLNYCNIPNDQIA